jgi:hypothetical protein
MKKQSVNSISSIYKRKRLYHGGAIITYTTSTDKRLINDIVALNHNIKNLTAEERRKKRTQSKMQNSGRFVKEYNSNKD